MPGVSQRHLTRKPFIIGVCGGTASGKVRTRVLITISLNYCEAGGPAFYFGFYFALSSRPCVGVYAKSSVMNNNDKWRLSVRIHSIAI
jgi:hypothetical protein